MRYGYFINLDERGEFSADVRDDAGKTVFEIEGFQIFEDGFMDHTTDIDNLLDYIVHLGIANSGDSLGKGN